jgi:hypothetical protein
MPRRAIDAQGDPHSGRSEFPHHNAQWIIDQAPAPTHNRSHGRRPHAHFDREDLFVEERQGLSPLDGVPAPPKGQPPVLFAYPAEDFDYARQTRDGRIRREGVHGALPPGPHRIITDRNKNIKGMTTHPQGDTQGFVRAPERVQRRPRRR